MVDVVVKEALEQFREAETAESENRIGALEDLRFRWGRQWERQDRAFREDDGRICVTINRIPVFVRRVVNNIRENRPAIKVRPVDSQADVKTARIYNGMIRAIEGRCNAETAYDWAVEYAITMGWGYFRVVTEYSSDSSFDQEIKIKRIRNPFSVIMDPKPTEPDGSDVGFAFIIDRMARKAFEKKYPKAHGTWPDNLPTGLGKERWFSSDSVQVAEYWTRAETLSVLSLLPDGTVVPGKKAHKDAINSRTVKTATVRQRVITAAEILEETTWLGSYIPIVPVYGEEIDIEGEMLRSGMVKDMKDSQRSYNFSKSVEIERTGLAPKVPWIGPTGTFSDPKWKLANRRNYPYLEYDDQGVPPQRTTPPDASPGLMQMQASAAQELRDVAGIHEAALGMSGPETAGTAIEGRQSESDISNFHYTDNLARAMRHAGRILVELIPKVYSAPQMFQILEPDGAERSVMINGQGVDPETAEVTNYQLGRGIYDVTVDTGPSHMTQRRAAVAGLTEIIKSNPQLIGVLGDMLMKSLDWPGAQEVAQRLKLLLPPEIAANENPQVAQQLQAMQGQVQQAQGVIGQLQQYVQQLEQQLRDKQMELQIKAGDLQRKTAEDLQDFTHDMTKLELDANRNVPGSAV